MQLPGLMIVLVLSGRAVASPCESVDLAGTWSVNGGASSGKLVMNSRPIRVEDLKGNLRYYKSIYTKEGNESFYSEFKRFGLIGKIAVPRERLCFVEFYRYHSKEVLMLLVESVQGRQMELSEYKNPSRRYIFELEKH